MFEGMYRTLGPTERIQLGDEWITTGYDYWHPCSISIGHTVAEYGRGANPGWQVRRKLNFTALGNTL